MAIYTPSNPYTTSWTFDNLTSGTLSFTSIISTEADWGYYLSFTDTAPDPMAYSAPGLTGMLWGGFEAGVSGPSASTTFTISYNVTETNPNAYITSLQQLYLVDALIGPGASATATEQAYDSAGNLVSTMTWSGTGPASTADNLAVGYQQLHVVLTVNLSIASTGLFTSVADISSIEQNFGETSSSNMAVIGDNVFLDTNGTGIQTGVDAGPPVAGVTVDLLQVNGSGVTQVATTTTNAEGEYQFVVVPGTYEVQFVAPNGDVFSPQDASSNPDLSSSPNPSNGITAPVVLTAGEVDNAVDAGLYMPAAFDVHVYYDANDNFTQDTGDTNQAGVTVTLLNGNGTPTGQTAVTDSNGNVSFTGLTPGSYEVAATTPAGDIVTQSLNVSASDTLVSGETAYAVEGLFSATPALSVVKTVTGITDTNHDGLIDAGDVINYNIQVTNTGNETLTGVTLVDPLTGGTIASNVTLAVGQQVDYATSYTVTQANVDNDGNAVGAQLYVSNMELTNGYEMVTFTGSSSWSGGTEYAGQMNLTVNQGNTDNPSAQFNAYAWCVDVNHDINLGANNIVYTLQQLSVPNAGVIAELAAWGDAQLASGPNALISAAVQADIWMQEYNVGLAAGTNAALVNEINYINGTVLPGLSANNAGLEITGVADGFITAQSLYMSQVPGEGDITNTATATSDQTGPVTSSVQTPISYAPGLELIKTISGVVDNNQAGIVTAGSVIDYTVEAINTGDVTLTGVTVIDPLTGATLAAGATLAVGASATYTSSYTISTTDIANDGNPSGSGDIVNTATATSNQTGPQTASASEAIVIPVTISGEVFLDKNDTGAIAGASGVAGVTVDLENAGGTILATTITNANGLYSFTGEAPGTYEVQFVKPGGYTYSPTGGSSASLANSVSGATSGFTLAPGQSESNVDAGIFVAAPALSIVKEVSLNNGATWSAAPADPTEIAGGAKPEYEFIVTNSGNVVLTNVAVTDSIYGTIGTIGSLAAGATTTLTATESWAAGQVTDTATAKGTYTPPGGSSSPVVSNTATAEYVGAAPGLSIVKEVSLNNGATWSTAPADPTELAGGAKPEYKFIVTNTGNVALSNVAVVDSLYGTIGTIGSLAAGTTTTLTATESWASGQVTDTATASTSYTDSEGNKSSVVSNTATAEYVGASPGLSIVKEVSLNNGATWSTAPADPTELAGGAKPEYEFIVTNTGNVALSNVAVADSLYGTIGTIGSLAAGATTTLTATETWASGQVTDTATASTSYTDSEGNKTSVVSNTATAEYFGATPSITVEKLISLDGGTTWVSAPTISGEPVDTSGGPAPEYEFIVTNAGNVALSNVTLADTVSSGGAINLGSAGTIGSLGVGASDTITATGSFAVGQNSDTATVSGTYTDSVGNAGTVSGSSSANYLGVQSTGSVTTGGGGLTVIKLPSQVVVGTGGQVTYTFDVINTGSTALTNVQISDNIGTAANPDYITPVLQTQTATGVLLPGQTWVYTATINQSGDYTSKGGSQSCSIGGQDLSGGCTAWLNSSFTPTSCKDGATYTFQDITCTIKGPDCGTITIQVPNACITFSSSCTQPTTTYNASENCWVTTLPANSDPGNVFLSGIPYGIASDCDLSGATCTWTIGESANNCSSSSISWQTGCTGYSSFDVNNCNGQADYNQIGVKVCDNSGGYGSGGNTSQGYGWNYDDSNAYCGSDGRWGWTGAGSDWNGSSTDCAGTPENFYCASNCGSGSSGLGGDNGCGSSGGSSGCGGGSSGSSGCGDGSSSGNGGTCGNGGGSGSVSCGQLGDSSQADTVTVTATTVGNGFSLGDAANYEIIAFGPSTFKGASGSPINGTVGIADLENCGTTTTVQLGGDKITGNLVTTSTKPSSTGGTVTGTISGTNTTLAADITALQTLGQTLGAEAGTSEKLTSSTTLQATAGIMDSLGDEVFTITQWANNITINGNGAQAVVLNIASGVNINLDNLTLTGGLTADQVLINDQNTGTISATSGDTFNGTVLAPNAVFNVAAGVTIDGHLYGGASEQTFSFTGGAKLNAPANTGSIAATTTLTESDSTEVQVLSSSSPITVGGTAPTGSLSSLYGTAEKLEFQYSPSDTVSLKQIQAGLASESGNNTNAMAFVVMSNTSNPYAANATIYFEGEVQSGEDIFADATVNQLTNTPVAAPNNHFSTTAGADLYMSVFSSQAAFQSDSAPIQSMAYNTSGSQAMHLGDQIGSLTLVGYVGSSGGHLVS